MDKLDIKSMTDSEICDNLIEYNLPKFRVSQIIEWARKGVNDFSEMTNLPISLREKLSEKFYLAGVKIRRKLVSEISVTHEPWQNVITSGGKARVIKSVDIYKPVGDRGYQLINENFYEIDKGFKVGFTTKAVLVEKDFPKPCIQLQVEAYLPWVID